MIRAFVFDFDGLILDTETPLIDAYAEVHAAHARHILELGPGTGAFTEAIARVMPDEADYLGLELNEAFVHRLHAQFPGMRFECCCAQKFDLKQPEFREGFDRILKDDDQALHLLYQPYAAES